MIGRRRGGHIIPSRALLDASTHPRMLDVNRVLVLVLEMKSASGAPHSFAWKSFVSH